MIKKVFVNDFLFQEQFIEIIESIFYTIDEDDFWLKIVYENQSDLFLMMLKDSVKKESIFVEKEKLVIWNATNIVSRGVISSINIISLEDEERIY